jgi:hypothetical protein
MKFFVNYKGGEIYWLADHNSTKLMPVWPEEEGLLGDCIKDHVMVLT